MQSYDVFISNVNKELYIIKLWADAYRLTLDISTTNVMFFSNNIVPSNVNSIKISSNSLIDIVNSCEFLEKLIHDRLSLRNTIKFITGKIARNTEIFHKTRNYLPLKARLNFYYGFIFPCLTYNVIVWGSTYDCY